MAGYRSLAILALVAPIVACSSGSHDGWTPKSSDEPARAAQRECVEQVDAMMRLRGYPTYPLPETPQAEYRRTIFDQCMRRKGYEAD